VLWFKFLVYIGAALIPLAVLLLTEGLLRRHAPRVIKAVIASGAVLFTVLALIPAAWIDPARLTALLVFQVASFIACGLLVWLRDQTGLSPSENMTAVRLGLSLFLLVPLCAADYLLFWIGLPLQMSALGVLVMCWLATSLGGTASQRVTLKDLAALLGAAALASVGLGTFMGEAFTDYIMIFALVLAAVMVASIWVAARKHRRDLDLEEVAQQLADAPQDDPIAFMRSIAAVPGAETADLVAVGGEIDKADLAQIFTKHPVVFAQTGASHLIAISVDPVKIAALKLPSLTQSQTRMTAVEMMQEQAARIAND